MRLGLGVGDGHHDEEGRQSGVGGEPFLARQHPVFAFAHCLGLHHQRVGAAVGLGHGEARHELVGQQGGQEALLLVWRAVVGQNLGVARVGCLATKDHRTEARAPQDLVHQGELHLPVTRTAQFGAQVTGPQVTLAYLLLQGAYQAHEVGVLHVVGAAQHVVQRLHFVAHELVDPVQFDLEGVVGFKVPTHVCLLFGVMAKTQALRPPSTAMVWPTT